MPSHHLGRKDLLLCSCCTVHSLCWGCQSYYPVLPLVVHMDLQLSRKGKQRQEAEDSTGDPTLSLTKALAKFKEVLTAEQKKQFEDSTAVPDAGSVLFFVAQLDAENASKTRRSIAPRLCTFLTATQQFAGAVETFVSSNPQTAALIGWNQNRYNRGQQCRLLLRQSHQHDQGYRSYLSDHPTVWPALPWKCRSSAFIVRILCRDN